ncbi:kinesin-like protein Kar3p [[Candida] railenensis]|uniref:Kinesin-like protein n=1 Tax=[Candida] railenensis TaxID=45579 RepID=A0A9P0VYX4_9ASCO|nr:kinesin-like protein Kar3p [[Candida] railenensis]
MVSPFSADAIFQDSETKQDDKLDIIEKLQQIPQTPVVEEFATHHPSTIPIPTSPDTGSKENFFPYKQSPNNKRFKIMHKPERETETNAISKYRLSAGRSTTPSSASHAKHGSENLISRLSRIESDQSQRLFKLHHSIDQQRDELSKISTTIMTLQTQRSTFEFEYFKQQDQLIKLKQQLVVVENEIAELKEHERDSLKEIDNKFELHAKTLNLHHEQELRDLKNRVSVEIEVLIKESLKKNQQELLNSRARADELELKIKNSEQDLNRKLIKLKEDHSMKLISLDKSMDESLKSLQEELDNLEQLKESRLNQIAEMEARLSGDIEPLLKIETEKLNEVMSISAVQVQNIKSIEDEVRDMEDSIESIESKFNENTMEFNKLRAEEILYNEKFGNQELQRRQLHNKLQELKGNIRVFCRIRPIISKEGIDDMIPFHISGDNMLTSDGKTALTVEKPNAKEVSKRAGMSPQKSSYKFEFDQVIPPSSTNHEIFEELSQLIQSALDGFNVCVFAYGQTGSGKTWTMSNPQDGMIPLSIYKIFQDIEVLKSSGWEYEVDGQFLEIYNESIMDLIGSQSQYGNNFKYEIKHDDVNGTTNVTNITTVSLTSPSQVNSILERAHRNRSTASTKSNERSSRSHSIFIIKIKGKNAEKGIHCNGTLNLIDLAGSERISNSQVTGDRLKETQAINKSLSSLGDVIYALAQEQQQKSLQSSHIPYRNSKLTYLLKNSLGGKSKTLMFVNVSPAQTHFNETLNSLRFATKVNSTKLNGKPKLVMKDNLKYEQP